MTRDRRAASDFGDDHERWDDPGGVSWWPGKLALTDRMWPVMREHTSGEVDADAAAMVVSAGGSGFALPARLRAELERALGSDLGGVRLHTDASSARAAESVSANAFAHGQDIHFGSGKYEPDTEAGRELIAHEVAHTVQQRGQPPAAQGDLAVSQPGDALEVEAAAFGRAFARGGSASVSAGAASDVSGIFREGTFVPQVARRPAVIFTVLNDPSSVHVEVSNARRAPAGTTYRWRLQSVDTEKLHPVQALQAARGTLQLKPKKVFQDLQVVPEVEVTATGAPPTVTPAPAVSVGVLTPAPQYSFAFTTGGRGAGAVRAGASASNSAAATCFVGDSVDVRAAFDNLVDGATAGIRFSSLTMGVVAEGQTVGRATMGAPRWEGATATVAFTATNAGRASITLWPMIPGADEEALQYQLDLSIVNDPRGFKDKCSTAQTLLTAKYSAGRGFFLTASQNYNAGYQSHKGILDARNRREQLQRDILLSVLFGTIGGAAGGAVGGAMKNTADAIARANSNAMAGAITDAAKDFTKAVARIPQQLLSRAGGSGAGGTGATIPAGPGAATGQAGATGAGAGNPAAQDPFGWFLGVERALESEKTTAANMLLVMHEAADAVLETGTEYEFDYDPVVALEERCTIDGRPLDQLGTPPEAIDYERAFWAAWLSQYAWTVSSSVHAMTERVHHYASSNVDGKLRDAINEVAARVGESGDAWIARYGADARARAEADARRYNEIEEG